MKEKAPLDFEGLVYGTIFHLPPEIERVVFCRV
jgi:hypothetical protein